MNVSTTPIEPLPLLLAGLVLMLQFLSCCGIALVAVLARKRLLSGESFSSGVGPSIWETFDLKLIVGVIIMAISQIFLLGFALARLKLIASDADRVRFMLCAQGFFYGIFLLLVYILLHRKQKTWRKAFGFGRCGAGRTISSAAVCLLAIKIPVELLALVTVGIFYCLGVPVEQQDILQDFLKLKDPWLRGGIVMLAVAGAPIFEEILFRGIIYPVLKTHYGFIHAAWVTSLLFAAFHFHPPSVLPLFGLAMGFTLLYEWTGSLACCILMHSMFNTLSLCILLLKEVLV